MASKRELWRAAAKEGGLTADQLALVAEACTEIPDLEPRLTALLALFKADLAGPFLHSLVEELERHAEPGDARVGEAVRVTLVGLELPRE